MMHRPLRFPRGAMNLKLDSDVQAVLEFMQKNIPCDRLIGVATSVATVSQILWAHHVQTSILPISLTPKAISETQLAAT